MVPAALAGILLRSGVQQARLIVSVVALAVVVTLLAQATTAGWLARRLGLDEPVRGAPATSEREPRVNDATT